MAVNQVSVRVGQHVAFAAVESNRTKRDFGPWRI